MNRERRFRLEDGAAAWLGGLVGRLPRGAAAALGRSLGRLTGDLDRRHVAIAADNLRRAFPGWDELRVLRTARSVYRHFGQVLLEVLWLSGRPVGEVMPFAEVVGKEHARTALDSGRGVIFPTAHIGNWELTALLHAADLGPFHVVARTLDNPGLDLRLSRLRAQWGNTVVNKRRALAQILTALRAGGGVGILIDQNVQEKDGVFVEFFGRPACTTTVAAALAVKTGCALVPGHTRLLQDGRYRLIYEPEVRWVPSGDRRVDVLALTERLTRIIEGWVREVPEQWLWMHRRWHTQPGPDASPRAEAAAPTAPAAPQAS